MIPHVRRAEFTFKRSHLNTLTKRQRVQDDELSLDTRLAAQAILNDEVIGRTTETVTPEDLHR